jgi:hypothetical protein
LSNMLADAELGRSESPTTAPITAQYSLDPVYSGRTVNQL